MMGTLHNPIAYTESVPDLKATGNIETFRRQIEETEDQIAAARRLCNGNVQDMNRRNFGIPGRFTAPAAGGVPARSFELDAGEAAAVYRRPDFDLRP